MACFASLVAPFGGFFASGFKRAFNIKDFGQSIPGHGGMTDRMDCQCVQAHVRISLALHIAAFRFLMGMFSYVYYTNLIRVDVVTVASVLQIVANGLSREEQFQLLGDLKRLLGAKETPAVS
jgi:phosphatidate cytidylyltransferase